MNAHALAALGLACGALLACGSDERFQGGSGSETTNTLQVEVVDPSGKPVALARVVARTPDDTTSKTSRQILTDASGKAAFADLPEGAWLEATAPDGEGAFLSLPVRPQGLPKLVVRALSRLEITGLAPGQAVSLPGLGRRVLADASGTARFSEVPWGAARVRTESFEGPVALPAGALGEVRVSDTAVVQKWPVDGSLDSLAIRRFLELSGLAQLATDSVTSVIRGRRARLDLSGRNLDRIHPGLGTLDFLLELNLSRNRLRTVPRELEALKAMDVLDLSRNPLDSVPPALRGMDSLRILDLDSCGLVRLPGWMGTLGRLWYLDVGYNQLDSLPASLPRLRRLGILDIFRNRIQALPQGFHHLDSLSQLWAETNRLATLPDSFERLPSLRLLQLDHNPLVALPDSIGSMDSLVDIRLSSSTLSRLPASMARLPLKHLEIYGLSLCPVDPPLAAKLDSLAGTSWRQNLRTDCP